jgi:hypothetical protein
LQALEERLPGIVQGKDQPPTDECLEAAELCFVKNYYATAAHLYSRALDATPRLTADLRAGHRFNAARAAWLAGNGRGADIAKFSEPEKQRSRAEALEWLRLELAEWAHKVENGTAADRIQAEKTLSRWRQEPDLAALRETEALDQLSSDERKKCDGLWSEVDAVIGKVNVNN